MSLCIVASDARAGAWRGAGEQGSDHVSLCNMYTHFDILLLHE